MYQTMLWLFVLAVSLATHSQAFAPASVQWGGASTRFVVVPASRNVLNSFLAWDRPLQLTIRRPHGVMSPNDILQFTTNPDHTITSHNHGWCIEASGTQSGDAVLLSRCSNAPTQKWNWFPWGLIQLRGSNQCLHVADSIGELDGAPIALRECKNTASETWKLEDPILVPMQETSQGTIVAIFMRHVMIAFIGIGVASAFSLSVWLWRWHAKACMVSGGQDELPVRAELGGVCLTYATTMRDSRLPLMGMSERMVPAVMALSEAAAEISATNEERNNDADDVELTENVRYTGMVKSFTGNYGFLRCKSLTEKLGKPEVFVHGSAVKHLEKFARGLMFSFRLGVDKQGRTCATDITPSKSTKSNVRFLGTVQSYNPVTKYGFLNCNAVKKKLGKPDVFTYATDVDLIKKFQPGQKFSFILGEHQGRAIATDVTHVEMTSKPARRSGAPDQKRFDTDPILGMRDFPPEELRLHQWLLDNFRDVSLRFGYEEWDAPVLESKDLYTREAGEDIQEQLYDMKQKGGRELAFHALRPELTPSLARLVLQMDETRDVLPLKWFNIGQCWRFERVSGGHLREHYQWNMDVVGVSSVEAEAELLASVVTLFKRLGLTAQDVGIKVNSRGLLNKILEELDVSDKLFPSVAVVVDKLDRTPQEEVVQELTALGLNANAVDRLVNGELCYIANAYTEELDKNVDSCSESKFGEEVLRLRRLFELAEGYGYAEWLKHDSSLNRGLSYYTGLVFEGFDREGNLNALFGGGRYDLTLNTSNGENIPACGFGFGDAAIFELLKRRDLLPKLGQQVDDLVVALEENVRPAAASLATQLRANGRSVDLVLEDKKEKHDGATRIVLLGGDEWSRGMVRVEVFDTGKGQQEMTLEEVVASAPARRKNRSRHSQQMRSQSPARKDDYEPPRDEVMTLWIGNLPLKPKNLAIEEELLKLWKPDLEVAHMMVKRLIGTNRSAFVRFKTVESSRQALEDIENGTMNVLGNSIKVEVARRNLILDDTIGTSRERSDGGETETLEHWSDQDTTLFIGDLPAASNDNIKRDLLKLWSSDLKVVELRIRRTAAFVRFETGECAKQAFKDIQAGAKKVLGKEIRVDVAKKVLGKEIRVDVADIDPHSTSLPDDVTTLFLGDLPRSRKNDNDDAIKKEILNLWNSDLKVVELRIRRTAAFVRFETGECAKQAFKEIEAGAKKVLGKEIRVEVAKKALGKEIRVDVVDIDPHSTSLPDDVTTLFFGDLPKDNDDAIKKEILNLWKSDLKVAQLLIRGRRAFVRFETVECAKQALEEIEAGAKEILGTGIRVGMSRRQLEIDAPSTSHEGSDSEDTKISEQSKQTYTSHSKIDDALPDDIMTLFVSDLPNDADDDTIKKELLSLWKSDLKVLHTTILRSGKGCYALVRFETVECSRQALEAIEAGKKEVLGRGIRVGLARKNLENLETSDGGDTETSEPSIEHALEPPPDEVMTLLIGNLPHDADDAAIEGALLNLWNSDLKARASFYVDQEVEMRDQGMELWRRGIVTSVEPLLVRLANVPAFGGLGWAEVRPMPEAVDTLIMRSENSCIAFVRFESVECSRQALKEIEAGDKEVCGRVIRASLARRNLPVTR